MGMHRVWCRVCNRMVEVLVDEAAGSVIAPLLGATAVGAVGASKRGVGGGVLGMLIGVAAGAVIQALVPRAQRLVCGECRHHVG